MRGIAGAVDAMSERAEPRISLLNNARMHRGADHSVIGRVGEVTLGNTRLAIQHPTSMGNRPFVSAGVRDNCVFNGEFRNHRELVERSHLSVLAYCDGEVVPHLWAKLGQESLAELSGRFAIGAGRKRGR